MAASTVISLIMNYNSEIWKSNEMTLDFHIFLWSPSFLTHLLGHKRHLQFDIERKSTLRCLIGKKKKVELWNWRKETFFKTRPRSWDNEWKTTRKSVFQWEGMFVYVSSNAHQKKKKKKKRKEVISMHMIDQGECLSAHTERDD